MEEAAIHHQGVQTVTGQLGGAHGESLHTRDAAQAATLVEAAGAAGETVQTEYAHCTGGVLEGYTRRTSCT